MLRTMTDEFKVLPGQGQMETRSQVLEVQQEVSALGAKLKIHYNLIITRSFIA